MNSCEAGGSRLGRFYPDLELDQSVLQGWMGRAVSQLERCRDCPVALICGGGCTRLALRQGGGLAQEVVCPPMANVRDLQVLVDYYLPLILESRGRTQ